MIWNSLIEHQNDKVFETLLNEAKTNSSLIRSSRHAAAVVYKKKILAIGHNKRKSHPIELKFQKIPGAIFLHAEKDAIIKTMNRYGDQILQHCSIYVLRVMKNGSLGYSKPCESCQAFIKSVGIKKIYWS